MRMVSTHSSFCCNSPNAPGGLEKNKGENTPTRNLQWGTVKVAVKQRLLENATQPSVVLALFSSFQTHFDCNKCWCRGPEPCHLVFIYFLWWKQQAHWHSVTLFWHNDLLPPPVTWTTHNTVHDDCCVNQTRTHAQMPVWPCPENTDHCTRICKQNRL